MNRIIVCIKPVPDPKHWHKVSMDTVTMTLKREAIPNVMNPLDKHALEAALRIRETRGGEVVLLSMAPPFAERILKEGLAMGADRAVLISDRLFAGSDSLATSRILAAGCRRIGDYDLVLLGNFSIDGSTAQVCSQLAEFLGLPNVMHVGELDWDARGNMIVTQRIENGRVKLLAAPPIVLSVRRELNKPRYVSFAGILAAEKKEIQVLSNEDLKLGPETVGFAGSPTKMAGLEVRRSQRARTRIEGTPEEMVQQLADRIFHYCVV